MKAEIETVARKQFMGTYDPSLCRWSGVVDSGSETEKRSCSCPTETDWAGHSGTRKEAGRLEKEERPDQAAIHRRGMEGTAAQRSAATEAERMVRVHKAAGTLAFAKVAGSA